MPVSVSLRLPRQADQLPSERMQETDDKPQKREARPHRCNDRVEDLLQVFRSQPNLHHWSVTDQAAVS